MSTCPKCGSKMVCWNWIESPDGFWYHECWDCDHVFETDSEILDGISYNELTKITQEKIDDQQC